MIYNLELDPVLFATSVIEYQAHALKTGPRTEKLQCLFFPRFCDSSVVGSTAYYFPHRVVPLWFDPQCQQPERIQSPADRCRIDCRTRRILRRRLPYPALQPQGDVFEMGDHLYAAKQPGQFMAGALVYFALFHLRLLLLNFSLFLP